MSEKTYISLNAVNVITISLAALLGYGVLVGATAAFKKLQPKLGGGV